MKAIILTVGLLACFTHYGRAQSTTGGRSGGSSASTGAGYESEGKRPAAGTVNSMTIADEGASRAYMYVPPTPAKNRSASPDGSPASKVRPAAVSAKKTGSKSVKKPK